MPTKACPGCGQAKPLSEFHRNQTRSDGRQTYCKACQRARIDTTKSAKRTEQQKKWKRENRERVAMGKKRWAAQNRERKTEQGKRYKERHSEKVRAHTAVAHAIRDGKLLKPDSCEDCGGLPPSSNLHGHHEDYSKPLEVEWLCTRCHGVRHSQPVGSA